jgi:solute carrier family 35 (UDP-galactose transporter), member B1
MATSTLVFYTLIIWASCIFWGVAHERIAGTSFSGESFRHIVVLNFIQSSFSYVAISSLMYILSSWNTNKRPESHLTAIIPSTEKYKFVLLALFHAVSSAIGFLAISYHLIDYPLAILLTSMKLLPAMMVGYVFRSRRFSRVQISSAILMTLGLMLYTTEHNQHISVVPSDSPVPISNATTSHSSSYPSSVYTALGVSLIFVNLFVDGIVQTGQDLLYQQFSISPIQFMQLQSKYISAINLSILFVDFVWNSSTSSVVSSYFFFQRHPEAIKDILMFVLFGAISQFIIYNAVKILSSDVTSVILTARKFVSVLISVILFHHVLSSVQWLAIGVIFIGFIVNVNYTDHAKEKVN